MDHKTVANVRAKTRSDEFQSNSSECVTGEIPQLHKTTGSDGKPRPASAKESELQRNSIQEVIAEHPEKSDRQIAKDLGVSDHTVANVRQKMDSENDEKECVTSQSARLHKTTGADGKDRPADESPAKQQ